MVCAVDAASLRTEASESSVAASHLPSVSPYDAELTKGHEGEHVTPWGCQGIIFIITITNFIGISVIIGLQTLIT